MEGTLLAIGGRYDYLLHSLEGFDHVCSIIFFFHASFLFEEN